jgi:hypothetical protein
MAIKLKTIAERLEGKFLLPDDICSGCWEWVGSKTSPNRVDGGGKYGELRINGKQAKAHRLSYEYFKGDIPKDMLVCHRCGNSLCINPAHLYLGTPKQNSEDMVKHGMHGGLKGEQIGNSKLSEAQVMNIRRRISSGDTGLMLAEAYGVTPALISSIKKRKIWRHI